MAIMLNEKRIGRVITPSPEFTSRINSRDSNSSNGGGSCSYDLIQELPSPASPDSPISPAKPLSYTGRQDVTKRCLDEPVGFATTWYFHPSVPGFPVCQRCFADRIRTSPFCDEFRSAVLRPPHRCRFSSPSMLDRFDEAVETDDLLPAVEWMAHRADVPDCAGANRERSRGRALCTPVGGQLPGLKVCEACYEDVLAASDFGDMFEVPSPRTEAGHAEDQDGQKGCSMALPYIRSAYRQYGAVGDWNGFLRESGIRLGTPPCPGRRAVSANPDASVRFFAPVDVRPASFMVCRACFCDYFTAPDDRSRMAELPALRQRPVRCSLGETNVRTAVQQAHGRGAMHVFWAALARMTAAPRCRAGGVSSASGPAVWYTLATEPPNFRICGGCHASVVATLGAEAFFKRKPAPPGSMPPLCCFHEAHPRGAPYLAKLRESALTGSAEPLSAYARSFSTLRPCPGRTGPESILDNPDPRRLWYGWVDGCLVCEECHAQHIRGTALEDALPLRGRRLPGPRACDFAGREDAREAWARACTNGDARGFRAWALGRRLSGVLIAGVGVEEVARSCERRPLGET